MANRCQLCSGYTTTLRRGLCRVCFDGNIRPSELFDEMTATAVRPAKRPAARKTTTTMTRAAATNGNGGAHPRPRATAGSGAR
jgi:hypothetical protein